jgi:hypothetical protein
MQSSDSDSQPSRWRLPPGHLEKLKSTLTLGVTRHVTPEQRAAIRQLCASPERWSYAPEDFLIAFKLAIVEAATAMKIPAGPERNDLMARLVSAYIEEFYRLGASPSANGAGIATHEIAPG